MLCEEFNIDMVYCNSLLASTDFVNCKKIKLITITFSIVIVFKRVVLSDDNRYFATASDDSTVKIWDTNRLDGKALTTRSKFNYTKQGR